ncbi:POK9 protein, partial [Pandion haliaetus]|nr:POK9 protein [Pandion haliaetus]
RGSLGVDVETAVDITLKDQNVTLIPTTAYGPLYHENSPLGGLLLGRSSVGKLGLIIIPGVIDSDFTGNIKIMAYTLHPPLHIPKGSKIAQIVAFLNCQPSCDQPKDEWQKSRGSGGFGSTGPSTMFTQKLSERSTQPVIIRQGSESVQLYPLLDTGADVTIID